MAHLPELSPEAEPVRALWTVGHSTRPPEVFVRLLQQHGISAIADVRRHPGSRRYPWFGSDALADILAQSAIAYQWIPELGGRRRPRPECANAAWRSAAFRGYADHMATSEFALGLARAVDMARAHRTALMCAESLWWRCHRRLIADLLLHRGWSVFHIIDDDTPQSHPVNPDARGAGADLIYPLPERHSGHSHAASRV